MYTSRVEPARRRAFYLILPGLAYVLLWLELFLPRAESPMDTRWFLVSALKSMARFAIILALRGGFPGKAKLPKAKEILDSLRLAALAAALAAAMAVALYLANGAFGSDSASFGVRDRIGLTPASPSPEAVAASLIWCLAVGYSEELFFRFFAPDSLVGAGFSPFASQAASAILFGLSHSAQGLSGILLSGILGLGFGLSRLRGTSFHALALGHAVYNALLLAGGLFSR